MKKKNDGEFSIAHKGTAFCNHSRWPITLFWAVEDRVKNVDSSGIKQIPVVAILFGPRRREVLVVQGSVGLSEFVPRLSPDTEVI